MQYLLDDNTSIRNGCQAYKCSMNMVEGISGTLVISIWVWHAITTLRIANSLNVATSPTPTSSIHTESKARALKSIQSFAFCNLCESSFMLVMAMSQWFVPCFAGNGTTANVMGFVSVGTLVILMVQGLRFLFLEDLTRPGRWMISILFDCADAPQDEHSERIAASSAPAGSVGLDQVLREESLQCITQGILGSISPQDLSLKALWARCHSRQGSQLSRVSTNTSTDSVLLEPLEDHSGTQVWKGQMTQ